MLNTTISEDFIEFIKLKIWDYENPKRVSLSYKYPFLKPVIIFFRHSLRTLSNFLNYRVRYYKEQDYFSFTIVKHQSVLRRKLGDSNPRL